MNPHVPTATIYDVARQAGVSHQTVSRVINGRPGVAAATRERVTQAAQQLRFVPNRAAQGLRSRQHGAVGCIIITEPGNGVHLPASTVERILSVDATVLLRLVERGKTRQCSDAITDLKAQHVAHLLIIDENAVHELRLEPAPTPEPTNRGPHGAAGIAS